MSLPGRMEILNEIDDLSDCNIPFYAYGDNEAAVEMAHRLEEINKLVTILMEEELGD